MYGLTYMQFLQEYCQYHHTLHFGPSCDSTVKGHLVEKKSSQKYDRILSVFNISWVFVLFSFPRNGFSV